ncbi:MAG: arylamine N-acetyltransferase [Oscillospiraceae bacterium]|nr:arylamine N-acetyltransferase [Oscillospiraceae bacterium]
MKKRVTSLALALAMTLSFSAQGIAAAAEEIASQVDTSKVVIGEVSDATIKTGPTVTLTYDGQALTQGEDFKVVNPSAEIGSVTADIQFIGDYSGTMEDAVSYDIGVGTIDVIYGRGTTTSQIKMSWTDLGCDEYYIYRYSSVTKNYVLYDKTPNAYYYDNNLLQFGGYYYKVKGVVHGEDGKDYYSNTVQRTCVAKSKVPTLKLAKYSSGVKLSWDKNVRAEGYKIYRSENGGAYKLIKKVTGTSWVDKTAVDGNDYSYKVQAYRNVKGTWYYSSGSNVVYTNTYDAILNAADLSKRHYEVKVHDAQGSTTVYDWTYTITAEDKKILDKFAKNFAGMTRNERLQYTLNWINTEVTYDTSYTHVTNSWVESIFTKKYGQCVQYNGAMAAMMAYMGYDVRVIKGWRCNSTGTSRWQHFWTEVDIDGVTYIMESGNIKKYGPWSYYLTPYEYTSGYMKNNTVM